MKSKHPTCTSLVEDALRQRDDFMTKRQLREATGLTANRLSAAMHNLWRRYKVIDCVLASDGTSWWWALPPEKDNRNFKRLEICEETKPRKPRKPKKEIAK